jgi:AcrR family transcriptional regulator
MPATTKSRKLRVDRRTRQARAEGRDARKALLEAAMDAFARLGYRDATVDEIAALAGYSKGAFYWHFSSKDDLFFALLEERIDRPWFEAIEFMERASPEQDIAPDGSRRFVEVLRGERELLLLDQEYWAQAARDPRLRVRYAKRQAKLRSALGRAIAARLEHLGAPPLQSPDDMATTFMGLVRGLGQEKLIDPDGIPDALLGDTFALIYAGHVARSTRRRSDV